MSRVLRHLFASRLTLRAAFSSSCLDAIEQAIKAAERTHGGELRFAVEGSLNPADVMRGHSARERALEVFSQLRIWDTEANNGVLIYLLWADQQVEIIADRGLNGKVTDAHWSTVCRDMESCFKAGNYERGVVAGIAAVSALLATHFPAVDRNELPDRPVVM